MSPAPKNSLADHCSRIYKDPETVEAYTDFSLTISSASYLDYTTPHLETHSEHKTELRPKARCSLAD